MKEYQASLLEESKVLMEVLELVLASIHLFLGLILECEEKI